MQRELIAQLLPTVFRRALPESRPLDAILGVMEAMHAPSEHALAHFDEALNPYTAPERFVPFLASWMGFDVGQTLLSVPDRRLRELIAMASTLAKWRGTAKGLVLFLEIATGLRGFVIEEPRPFHFVLRAPAIAAEQRELIARVIESEKPAYVTSELVFA
ncbi:MAG TPA: phage tail protein [Thermoanaerobaculia bacterium]